MSLSQIQQSTAKTFIGCDEVGYGCAAGPLVVCGVKAPKDWNLEGLNDSKKLSEKKRLAMREKLLVLVKDKTISYHIAERPNVSIDQFGLGRCLKTAYVECMTQLNEGKDSLIIADGILKFDNLGVDDYDITSLVKADTQIPTVMAASILAKTYRDGLMKVFHHSHPEYDWDSNVGYLSPKHIEAIKKHGLSPLHRKSYNLKCLSE